MLLLLLLLLPIPRHPPTARAPPQRRRCKRVWWALRARAQFVALNAIKFRFTPIARQAAAETRTAAVVVVAAATRCLLAADVVLFAVEGLEEGFEALSLRGDVGESVVWAADRVGHEVCSAAAEIGGLSVLVASRAVEGAGAAEGLVDEPVKIVAAARRRHLEAAHEVLCIALPSWARRLRLASSETEDVDLDVFDGHFDVDHAGGASAVVALAY